MGEEKCSVTRPGGVWGVEGVVLVGCDLEEIYRAALLLLCTVLSVSVVIVSDLRP